METRSKTLRALGLAGAAAVLWPPIRTNAQSSALIHVAMPGADDGTPMLYAIHAGLLRRAGIEIDIAPAQSGAAVSAAVAGGSIQLGISSLVPLIGAHARGLSFQLIVPAAVYTSEAPYAAMVVKKDGPIRSARDLNGKTVTSSALRDLIATSNLAWIDQNGGDSTTVKTVELPQSSILPAVDEGRVDAGTLLEPRLSEALDSGKVRVLAKSFDAYGKHFVISGWFATAEYINRNRDTIVRFARALRESNAYCNTHHSETAPLLAEHSKVDVKTVEHSTRVAYGDVLDLKEIQNVIDVSAKYKVIERPFEAREMVSPAVAFLVR
jgi:NitT/TauT family transport system substrate-binding protein